MADVFLYAPQDFRNLCAIARTLEVLGTHEVYAFDPWRLIRDRYGKSRSREMRDVSGGAFHKIRWNRVEEPEAFMRAFPGRTVATVADASAAQLTSFAFQRDDLLLFGGESQGLPANIVALANQTVTMSLLPLHRLATQAALAGERPLPNGARLAGLDSDA